MGMAGWHQHGRTCPYRSALGSRHEYQPVMDSASGTDSQGRLATWEELVKDAQYREQILSAAQHADGVIPACLLDDLKTRYLAIMKSNSIKLSNDDNLLLKNCEQLGKQVAGDKVDSTAHGSGQSKSTAANIPKAAVPTTLAEAQQLEKQATEDFLDAKDFAQQYPCPEATAAVNAAMTKCLEARKTLKRFADAHNTAAHNRAPPEGPSNQAASSATAAAGNVGGGCAAQQDLQLPANPPGGKHGSDSGTADTDGAQPKRGSARQAIKNRSPQHLTTNESPPTKVGPGANNMRRSTRNAKGAKAASDASADEDVHIKAAPLKPAAAKRALLKMLGNQ